MKTVEIQKKDRFWVRKFITTNEPGDGLTRVKTALRVAKALHDTKKADLVQVVVLDANGPKDRSGMRGRAVGADVIYVPDPSHVPEEVSARVLTARYVDGTAAANGEFFGERVDMVEDDIQALLAKLNDQTDCVKPEVVVPEGEGHGAEAGGHGEAPAHGAEDAHGEKPAEGHGEAEGGHGAEEGHGGDAEGGHGETPAGEHGEETPVAEDGAEESKGWMASLMGMVGLGGDEAPADGHAAPADGHAAPADDHGAVAEDTTRQQTTMLSHLPSPMVMQAPRIPMGKPSMRPERSMLRPILLRMLRNRLPRLGMVRMPLNMKRAPISLRATRLPPRKRLPKWCQRQTKAGSHR